MDKQFRILVCPLNWGLGHATRMIPVVNQLIENNFEVIIAADGAALEFLKKEFPNLNSIQFSHYNITYSKGNTQVFRMARLLPLIVYYTIKEHFVLKKIIDKEKIDCVISDNRYGLYNKSAYTIFITHQLRVLFPRFLKIFEPIFLHLVRSKIKKYNECWIPDFEGDLNLSGKLSHHFNYPNLFYIGPLSRFQKTEKIEKKKYECLILLSGPEPQRTILEQRIYRQLSITNYNAAIVKGVNLNKEPDTYDDIDVYGMLNTQELFRLIQESDVVVCRSGYSSIMDLVALQKTAVLVPTPGQTEQEYLADYLYKKGIFYYLSQKEFCIEKALKNKLDFSPFFQERSIDTLNERIKNLKFTLESNQNNKRNK